MVELSNKTLIKDLSNIVKENYTPTKRTVNNKFFIIDVHTTSYIYIDKELYNQEFERLTNYIRTSNIN